MSVSSQKTLHYNPSWRPEVPRIVKGYLPGWWNQSEPQVEVKKLMEEKLASRNKPVSEWWKTLSSSVNQPRRALHAYLQAPNWHLAAVKQNSLIKL